MTLYLEAGAILKGSPDMRDYPGYGYIHNELGEVRGLLHADFQENINIAGEGEIDFNGDVFYDYSRPMVKELDIDALSGNRLDLAPGNTVKELEEGKVCWLYAEEVENVSMEDVTVMNGMLHNKMEVAQYIINCKGMKLP